jgi:hypothetical protein
MSRAANQRLFELLAQRPLVAKNEPLCGLEVPGESLQKARITGC